MQNRRAFIQSMLSAPLVLAGAGAVGGLAASRTMAANTADYRALVCVFLFGGMDCHDTVLPSSIPDYADYAAIRATLLDAYAALPGGSTRSLDALLPLGDLGQTGGVGGFALPPQLGGLHDLYRSGRAAIVGNVGPLVEPTDRASFNSGAARLPVRLFSHNDQQSTWMSFAPEGSQLGWGGLFGDAATRSGANAQRIFSQISLAGNAVFLTGQDVSPYQISANGVPSIRLISAASSSLTPSLQQEMRDHFRAVGSLRDNLFEQDLIDLSRVSLDANDSLDRALQGASGLDTVFPATALGGQLRKVAETIDLRDTLGARRQVFFVALGGFDTHSAQANDLPALQQDIGDSIAAFYTATEELGVADQVTTFTAADFGRTLTVNGDGSDHGWGSHHFVVGGAVRGGEIYGDIPPPVLGHSQDAGNGRLIPTTSVEQFAAPLGRWYGLTQAELEMALPGLANFTGPWPDFI
ncbi:MAG: DUF1501 domain-containing protein [Pseudomonadota bacterium]